MATLTLNNSLTIPNLASEELSQFVSINDYNKLRSKYENKVKENKNLKEYLENIMNSYETIKESKKAVEGVYESIRELIKTNKFIPKAKEEFSTSYSHYEYLGSDINKTSAKSCSCCSSTINFKDYLNTNLLKKIEEVENSYNEILNNFYILAMKYKITKEEKSKIEDNNMTLLDQISTLNEEYKRICNEIAETNITIQRFKEIDKCLVDSSINTLFLITNEKIPVAGNLNDNNNNNNPDNNPNNKDEKKKITSYVLCEPVPTFVKFINKFTK